MRIAAQYARAIYEAKKSTTLSDTQFMASIRESLKRRHHERMLPQIFEEYRRITERERGEEVTLRVARGEERADGLLVLKDLGIGAEPRTVLDPALVGGFVLSGKDFRYDASAKRALIDLYKRLTA